MVILERRRRNGPILTPSSLPCLGDTPTINVTEGCAHCCAYCYTRGYSNYPGDGRVVLFDNTPELVRAELPRKRRKPKRVYFSPSSDAFQPLAEIQDVTYETMKVLLEAGVEVAFLTKGSIENRFISLFAASPARVFAQIGITTLDECLRQGLEPGAAPPSERLQVAAELVRTGVATNARLDPLIPGLTDTMDNLSRLLAELGSMGVRSIAASYLFLRPAFARRLLTRLDQIVGVRHPGHTWAWKHLADGVGGGQMPAAHVRQAGFERLTALASDHGMEVHVCACKNPDLAARSSCRIAGPSPPPSGASLWGDLG